MLKKWHILVSIIIAVSVITVLSISAEESLIPSWIKTTASFWVNDQVSDQEFINAIQFLINNGMIKVSPQPATKAPTSSPTPSSSYSTPAIIYHPSNELFLFENNKNQFTGHFALITDSGNTVTANGKLFLKITNSNGQEVYSDRIYVNKDMFEPFEDYYGKKYTALEWSIPIQKIARYNYPSGTLSLIFETDATNYKPKEILVSITGNLPTTGISSGSTSLGSSGINVGKDMNVGPFKITIEKVSFVEDQGYPYGKYLRLDMSVYNKRNETVELQFSKTTLTDDKKIIYDAEWQSKYNLQTSYPKDTTKKGYMLFEDVPTNVHSIKLFLEVIVIADIYTSDTYYYNDELEIILS